MPFTFIFILIDFVSMAVYLLLLAYVWFFIPETKSILQVKIEVLFDGTWATKEDDRLPYGNAKGKAAIFFVSPRWVASAPSRRAVKNGLA
ncbi:hypothetical protein LX32DRAFT_310503 [Colletotrichum zoysiae]|uniref:Uncharacterized protein n=1 Tax=Colletotrichum zoysiae TaxID=1216348 RepID=A0AAD9HKH6_9PEZI|nr:hypothetical protein LX32DRAFT_310503 [Colletotrichum zoysiae]